jgi:hypothetical protein
LTTKILLKPEKIVAKEHYNAEGWIVPINNVDIYVVQHPVDSNHGILLEVSWILEFAYLGTLLI